MNQINSIPEATNRLRRSLIIVVPEESALAAIQVAGSGIAWTILRRTPPATADTNEEECRTVITTATATTLTARKT